MVYAELEKKVKALEKRILKLEKQNAELNERLTRIESSQLQDEDMPLTPQGRMDLWASSQR